MSSWHCKCTVLLIFAVCFFLASMSNDVSAENEDAKEQINEGFRGVKWGSSPHEYGFLTKKKPPKDESQLLKYHLNNSLLGVHYVRTDPILKIKNIPLDNIYYIFMEDHFWRVQIEYEKIFKSEILKLYEDRYGSFEKIDNYIKRSEKTIDNIKIVIRDDRIVYIYIPILEKLIEGLDTYSEDRKERKEQF